MSGTLFVVATPIGNLDDWSSRAVDTLRVADFIAAEDTRHTGRLLSHFGIKTPTFALHEHNEDRRSKQTIERLLNGETIALVSDAGTPLLSDPGYRLIRLAHESGVPVVPIPGPSALTAALSVAGLPTNRFCFEGFLPAKAQARKSALTSLAAESRTLVFFESVHRISETIDSMAMVFGADRKAFIGRELSKLHEQSIQSTLGGLRQALADGEIPIKGEFVVVVQGAEKESPSSTDLDSLLEELIQIVPGKQAAEIAARLTGGKRNEVYQRMLELNRS